MIHSFALRHSSLLNNSRFHIHAHTSTHTHAHNYTEAIFIKLSTHSYEIPSHIHKHILTQMYFTQTCSIVSNLTSNDTCSQSTICHNRDRYEMYQVKLEFATTFYFVDFNYFLIGMVIIIESSNEYHS